MADEGKEIEISFSTLRKSKVSIESYMYSDRSLVLEDGLDNMSFFSKYRVF